MAKKRSLAEELNAISNRALKQIQKKKDSDKNGQDKKVQDEAIEIATDILRTLPEKMREAAKKGEFEVSFLGWESNAKNDKLLSNVIGTLWPYCLENSLDMNKKEYECGESCHEIYIVISWAKPKK